MIDHYEIDWTTDPSVDQWKTIHIETATGSLNEQIYAFEHKDFSRSNLNYYRLVRVDNNGVRVTFPEIRVVDNRTNQLKLMKVLNVLGQEVTLESSGAIIYMYEDGTIERVFNR